MKIAASAPNECPIIMIGPLPLFADGPLPLQAPRNQDDHESSQCNRDWTSFSSMTSNPVEKIPASPLSRYMWPDAWTLLGKADKPKKANANSNDLRKILSPRSRRPKNNKSIYFM